MVISNIKDKWMNGFPWNFRIYRTWHSAQFVSFGEMLRLFLWIQSFSIFSYDQCPNNVVSIILEEPYLSHLIEFL